VSTVDMKTTHSLCLAAALCFSAACATPRASLPPATTPAVVEPVALAPSAPAAVSVSGCPALGANAPTVRFGAEEMVPLCSDVYVEPALTREDRERVGRLYGPARDDVERGLGPLVSSPPLAIFCKTAACADYFAGTARRSAVLAPGRRLPGATYVAGPRLTIVILRIDDGARGYIAHERVHVEVGTRLGHEPVPTWFHEGLAAHVSGAPSCTGVERGVDDLRRLDQSAAWGDYTNAPSTMVPTYCQARAEVEAWVRRFGEPGLLDLLGKVRDGASFADVYGPMLTQGPGEVPTVLVSSAPSLGDGQRPFSLAMWIKPAARAGVLAHVSSTAVGTGWCAPFLGYDGDEHLVSQIFHGDGPAPASFAIAVDTKPRPLGKWTHVAMTWAPGSANRLYVDGVRVGEATPPRYRAPGAGPPVYVAWGSSNVGGTRCFRGAVTPGALRGKVADPRVYDTELGAADVAALARTPP
jgi:hypothetical protein